MFYLSRFCRSCRCPFARKMSYAATADANQSLAKLCVELPPASSPTGPSRRVLITGSRCLVSGSVPLKKCDSGWELISGRVGNQLTIAQGKEAARSAGLGILSALQNELGSLQKVSRLVRTLALVNCEATFEPLPVVADGFSELMKDVFGEQKGVGTRSVFGATTLPYNIAVEIEAEFELHDIAGNAKALHYEPSKSTQPTRRATNHIYARWFGMHPVINCFGNLTSVGGSRMKKEVTDAMAEAAEHFVDMHALQRECGRRLAQLCRCPQGYSAFITTGASAGLALVAASCIAGTKQEVIARLPHTTNEDRCHIIMDGGHDLRWNQAISSTGARICLLGSVGQPMTTADLETELSGPRRGHHACIICFEKIVLDVDFLPLKDIMVIAQRYDVPVIVDAAAQLPPRSNLWRWTNQGVDAVIYSGGKQLAGPQTSGLVLAKQELINKMALNGSPHESTVCRPMKCSKEDMIGLVKAVELYVQGSDEYDLMRFNQILDVIQSGLVGVAGIASLRRCNPSPGFLQPNTVPRLYIDLVQGPAFCDETANQTPGEGNYKHDVDYGQPLAPKVTSAPTAMAHRLATGNPSICVNTSENGIAVSPMAMNVDEAPVVLKRILSVCDEMWTAGELLRE